MKISRLISIIMTLLNCEKISANKLAEMNEVNVRTIYRDIEAISLAGIPIIATQGVNGGIGIMKEYKVDKKFFTIKDISNILMGLESLDSVVSNREISGTIEKIKNLGEGNFQSKVVIDMTTWQGNKGFLESLDIIKIGLENNKIISFKYKDIERRIEPYRLILKEGKWYLQGYCLVKNAIRIFKVLRMSEIVLKDSFKPRELELMNLSGKGWADKKIIDIKIIVDKFLLEEMIERCGIEKIEKLNDDKFLINFPFIDDEWGYNILLSYGNRCECIEPEYIREKLKNKIEELVKIYKEGDR